MANILLIAALILVIIAFFVLLGLLIYFAFFKQSPIILQMPQTPQPSQSPETPQPSQPSETSQPPEKIQTTAKILYDPTYSYPDYPYYPQSIGMNRNVYLDYVLNGGYYPGYNYIWDPYFYNWNNSNCGSYGCGKDKTSINIDNSPKINITTSPQQPSRSFLKSSNPIKTTRQRVPIATQNPILQQAPVPIATQNLLQQQAPVPLATQNP